MIHVLDTNVVSELLEESPHPNVLAWYGTLRVANIFLTATTHCESWYGIEVMAKGKRRTKLAELYREFCRTAVAGILIFDAAAAEETSVLLAKRKRMGRAMEKRNDATIAGVVLRLNNRDGLEARIATRNVKDFLGVPLINPWEYDPAP